jgi:hypothetical protein
MQSAAQQFRRRRLPSGFTLLETMLVISLCTVLLAATWSSTQLYWNYRLRSQERIASTGLLLAVHEDLQLDLRALAAFPPTVPESLVPSDPVDSMFGLTPLIKENEFREKLLQLDPLSAVVPVRFAGGPDWMAFLSSQGSPRFPSAYAEQQHKHIVWCASDGRKLQVPVAGLGDTLTYATIDLTQQPAGIVRFSLPFNTGQSAQKALHAPPLVEERIAGIQFEYFDGVIWQSNWSPENPRQIPVAVRVCFRPAKDASIQPPIVVAIPQSWASVPEEES